MPVESDSPMRRKSTMDVVVWEWQSGCLYCGDPAEIRPLPDECPLCVPLCPKHRRWAMASRRERIGKQAGKLKLLLIAWSKRAGTDPREVSKWLGY